MFRTTLLANLLAAAYAHPSSEAASWTPGQEVSTQSGLIKGHVGKWPVGSEVSEYLGIPYAKPPVGPLRFAPPVLNKSNATFIADKYANDCVPTMGGMGMGGMGTSGGAPELKAYGNAMGGPTPEDPHKYDEDCLGLNVWTKPQTGEKSKAVLMWIYGGAFSSGTAHAPYMNGGRLANEEDVVVVSFNYRVGLNGFPGAPGLEYQNPGLMDVRLATEWVRDNIDKFGGDPKRITIFGESAGGAAVDYYAFGWPKDPIVNGFICQSGTVSNGRGMRDQAPTFDNWYKLSEKLGCGGKEAAGKTVECVRGKPGDDVSKAANSLGLNFGPRADEKVVFSDIKARGEAGNFIKRPLIAGNTDFEAGLTLAMAGGKGGLGPLAGLARGSEGNSGCGAAVAAQVRLKHNVPAWVFRFDGVYENQKITANGGAGAYHSSDVPMAFGTTELRPGPKDTPEQAKLSQHWRHAWAEFAKDPDNGLKKLGWPVYDPAKDTLVRLGYKNGSEPVFASNAPYVKSC